jgi:hypothetical protein
MATDDGNALSEYERICVWSNEVGEDRVTGRIMLRNIESFRYMSRASPLFCATSPIEHHKHLTSASIET